MSEKKAHTLIERRHEAQKEGYSKYVGTVAYFLRDEHFDPRGYDQTRLTIVLATFLAYLYTRNWQFLLIGMLVWFLLESAVWALVGLLSPPIKAHLLAAESRDWEPLVDWIIFLFAFGFSISIIEFSIVNNGDGSIPPLGFPVTSADWGAAISVVLISLLSCYRPLYYWSFGLLQLTIWIAYFVVGTDLNFWIAIRASAAALYFYAWFMNPIAFSFSFNAVLSLAAGAFVFSLITGLVVV